MKRKLLAVLLAAATAVSGVPAGTVTVFAGDAEIVLADREEETAEADLAEAEVTNEEAVFTDVEEFSEEAAVTEDVSAKADADEEVIVDATELSVEETTTAAQTDSGEVIVVEDEEASANVQGAEVEDASIEEEISDGDFSDSASTDAVGDSSYTSGDWTYTLSSDGLTLTGYTGSSTTLDIPETLDGYKVTSIGRQAFINNTTIKKVTIPKDITSIKAEAFYGCIALSEIYFNAVDCTVAGVWIYASDRGAGVFSGAGSASADGLTVYFGSGVKKVPDNLFNTASSDEYGKKGYAYASVTAVEFADSTTEIGEYAFYNCKELASLTLGDNVTKIDTYAFYGCVAMKSLTVKNALSEIGSYAFAECDSLLTINWGSGLGTIGDRAFYGCDSLTTVDIPDPVNSIGAAAFANCQTLETVTLPSTLVTLKAEVFYGCIKLANLTINSTNLTVPGIWIYASDRGAGVFSGAGSSSLVGLKVTFGSGVTKVPDGLFDTASSDEYGKKGYEYAYVTEIDFGSSVTEIGSRAFYNCKKLTEVKLGNSVQTIGSNAFENCIAVKTLTLSDVLKEIGAGAFKGCTTLDTIDWGTGLGSIGSQAFYGCTALNTLSIPDPVSSVGTDAFAYCTKLSTVVLPKSLTTLGGEAFYGCSKLADLTINCENLTVPDVWIYSSDKGAGVFSGAGSAVTDGMKVTFGSGVSSISAYLFDTASITDYGHNGYDFAYVSSVTIPDSVSAIGDCAFRSCQKLQTVTVYSAAAVFGSNVFDGCSVSSAFQVVGYYGGTAVAYAAENSLPYGYLTPKTPIISEISQTDGALVISWGSTVGAKSYELYRKAADGSWSLVESTEDTSGTDTDVTSGSSYTYAVKACVGSLSGELSEEKTAQYHVHEYVAKETVSAATVFKPKRVRYECSCGESEVRSVGSKKKPTIKVNMSTVRLKVKQSTTALKVTGLAAGDKVKSYKSSNKSIVKVNKKGKLTAGSKTGTAMVTITLKSGKTKKIKVIVQEKTVTTTKITGLSKKLTIAKGKKVKLTPVLEPLTSQEKITYSSSNSKIATVSSKGVIEAHKIGSAKITVKSGKKKFVITVKVK